MNLILKLKMKLVFVPFSGSKVETIYKNRFKANISCLISENVIFMLNGEAVPSKINEVTTGSLQGFRPSQTSRHNKRFSQEFRCTKLLCGIYWFCTTLVRHWAINHVSGCEAVRDLICFVHWLLYISGFCCYLNDRNIIIEELSAKKEIM